MFTNVKLGVDKLKNNGNICVLFNYSVLTIPFSLISIKTRHPEIKKKMF